MPRQPTALVIAGYSAPAAVLWQLDWPAVVALWAYLAQGLMIALFMAARGWRSADAGIAGGMRLRLAAHPQGVRLTARQQCGAFLAIVVFTTYLVFLIFFGWIQWNVGTRPTLGQGAGIAVCVIAYGVAQCVTFQRQRESDRYASWRVMSLLAPAFLRLAPVWMTMLMLDLPALYPETTRFVAIIALLKVAADLIAEAADRWMSRRARSRTVAARFT